MTIAIPTSLTLTDFLKLPETQPASEFTNGFISQKPMPQGKHTLLQLKFCQVINLVAEPEKIALAFPELCCTFGDRSLVPDATVFTWSRIVLETNGEVASIFNIYPDWTVEILSPDQKATKVISNILHCLKYGTQLGWLIDPKERLVLAFRPGQEPMELMGDNLLPMPDFLDLELTVANIFGWLKVG